MKTLRTALVSAATISMTVVMLGVGVLGWMQAKAEADSARWCEAELGLEKVHNIFLIRRIEKLQSVIERWIENNEAI